MTNKGVLIAASVAGLFASTLPLTASAEKTADEVQCEGVNACKGKGSCHGGGNSCAGSNACKGKGWVKMPASECKAKGGKVLPAK